MRSAEALRALPLLAFAVGAIGGAALRGPPRAVAPADERERVAAPAARAGSTAPAPAGPSRADLEKRLGETIARLVLPPTGPCDAVINGVVRDKEGRGVPGVRIAGLVRDFAEEAEGETESEGGDEIIAGVARIARRLAFRTETRTGEGGTFSLPTLRGATLSLSAEHEDFSIRMIEPGGGTVAAGSYVLLEARRRFAIPVQVVLPDGSAPAKATIEVSTGGDAAWSPQEPFVRLEAGTYTVRAIVEGEDGAPRLASDRCGTSVPRSEAQPVRLALRVDLAIDGRVIVPGEARARAYVRLRSGNEQETEPEYGSAVSEFSFGELEPGTYHLEAGFTPFAVDASATVVLSDRAVTQDLVLPRPGPADFITIWTRDHRGRTLVDVDYRAEWRTEDGRPAELSRGLDGSCRILLGPSFGALARASECTIRTAPRLYWEQKTVWKPGDPREVTFLYEEPALLELVVPGFPPDSGATAVFELFMEGEGEDASGEWETSLTIEDERPVLAGPLKLGHVRISGGYQGDPWFGMSPVSVDLVPGINRLALPFPRLCDLTVRGLAEPAHVSVDSAEGSRYESSDSRLADEEGRAVFKELPAGDYIVKAESPSGEQIMRVTVDRTLEVQFDGRAVNALRVERDLEELDLLEGDSIVGYDGKRFANERDIDRLEWLSLTRRTVELIVRRGDDEITKTCDLRTFLGAKGEMAGVRFDP